MYSVEVLSDIRLIYETVEKLVEDRTKQGKEQKDEYYITS